MVWCIRKVRVNMHLTIDLVELEYVYVNHAMLITITKDASNQCLFYTFGEYDGEKASIMESFDRNLFMKLSKIK